MSGPCIKCGTNGDHYCPADLCRPDEDDLAPGAYCPECNSEGRHLGALGYRDYFRCIACGWDWSVLNRGRAQADYEDACNQQRKARLEEG